MELYEILFVVALFIGVGLSIGKYQYNKEVKKKENNTHS